MASPGASDPCQEEIDTTLLNHGYERLDSVGKGNYASVYKVRSFKYNEIFCVKVMRVPEGDKAKEASRIRSYGHEINSLMQLSHPNIINFYDHFTSDHCFYIVLEYCPNGSLKDWIDRERQGGDVLQDMMRQLLGALACCHEQRICHRDIKPQNVLIDKYGHLKLADFGLAAILATKSSEKVGSLPYMAPEAFDARARVDPYACDVWSMGVTFFQMATGFLPWTGTVKQMIVAEIRSGDVPYPIEMEKSLQSLLKRMLDTDPSRRAKAAELLTSEYLGGSRKLQKTLSEKNTSSNDNFFVHRTRVGGSLSGVIPAVQPTMEVQRRGTFCVRKPAQRLHRPSMDSPGSCAPKPANWKLHFPIAATGLLGKKT